ncbi:MAG: NAD(P)-dependent oxidoreductase [Porticoccaceae bacterium]|nr:NAD(P)-dependent oxidoreductase [Porticoccaceae bacterium]|tara:strand:- start:1133 stop:2014 length:882 start_codon:yes stop_codon:yes gene_type:complete
MISIGFLGLGKMGSVMAPLLIEAGYDLSVWNRNAEKANNLVSLGAKLVSSPAALASTADVVVSMLADDAAVIAVYEGPDGLLSVPVNGKLFIDMSTLRPPTVHYLAKQVQDSGASFVDAPVSGTVAPAKIGKLLVLCGASKEDFERAQPILDIFGRRIVHAGPVGQGTLLKLVVNLPLAVYWGSLAEAIAMGNEGGLDLNLMLDTIQDSSAALAVLGLKIPTILGEPSPVAFDVASMKKDLLSMLDTGENFGVPMPATNGVLETYSATLDDGYGDADAVEIIRYITEKVTQSR